MKQQQSLSLLKVIKKKVRKKRKERKWKKRKWKKVKVMVRNLKHQQVEVSFFC